MANILSPNSSNMSPFGKIIHYPNKQSKGRKRNLWRIVHNEPAKVGWRVAYLVLLYNSIGRMECHPTSDETFDPVKGKALIFVALNKSLDAIKCFYLDKPIILRKGVWHGLIALDDEAEIKIIENHKVTCRYWKLGFRVKSYEEILKRLI